MDVFHLGERGFVSFECGEKFLEIRFVFGFEVDLHATADVFDPAGVIELFGDSVDEGAESNTLDNTEHHGVYRFE